MLWRPLSHDEVEALLLAERIVRVGFSGESNPYVIPLGYVWVDGAMWGTTRRGRKTELANRDPRVGFTVDDSLTSRPHYWRSCVGRGEFEVVPLDEFLSTAAARLRAAFPDNPESHLRDWTDGLSDGSSVCWRIRPSEITGRVPMDPS